MSRLIGQPVVFTMIALITGCGSYTVPGGPANLGKLTAGQEAARDMATDSGVLRALERKPLASFPAALAVVRVQAPEYRSYTAKGWGHGNYSVVVTRDIEKPEQVARLAKLPMVKGIAPLGQLMLAPYACNFQSDLQLRQAAANAQADLLLVYTFDTNFTTEDKAKPLTLVSLGLSPNTQVRLTTTASAVLMDTRNGYVYGLAEATAQRKSLTKAWQDETTVDETRRQTESEAFDKLVGEFENTWRGVVAAYANNSPSP